MASDSFLRAGAVQPRDYQSSIAGNVLRNGNSLVVLPTGLGKTVVALLVMDAVLREGKRVLFMAPTKPLAEQHVVRVLEMMLLSESEVVLLTGETKPENREAVWKNARVISATPQTVQNDLRSGIARVSDFGLVVFDESHRAVGDYAYTFVANECKASKAVVLALTASPGGSRKKIEETMKALGISNVEARSEADEDVAKYVKQLDVEWVFVELPVEYALLKQRLGEMVEERVGVLRNLGYVYGNVKTLRKKALIEMRKRILRDKRPTKYPGMMNVALLFNLVHAHELLETQSVGAFLDFFKRMNEREEKSKAVLKLLSDERTISLLADAEKLSVEHPKIVKLVELISARQGKTFIVFVQYRDQIKRIVERLNSIEGVKALQFVGKRDGVSQKEQQETIEAFRRGEFNVLVASSIGEEGLDIPQVDCVVFYEPIPSEIRSIQRRGRAGRAKAGEAIILITKGTRDESYFWSSRAKETKMKRILKTMSGETPQNEALPSKLKKEKAVKKGQSTMADFV
ncbi:DEAD/DEAH box helicase [Candidatus Micrarchaeota archaeon]|nr:DEAD/DEAH box helicase [Candidatus Micrarchaeota archaeon]